MAIGSPRACEQTDLTDPYPGAERLLGVYPQRQPGLFMQRIRVLGGRIHWRQWQTVIELARRYSRRSTLHITTRQDIELHDLAGPHLQIIQQELAQVGLITRGACGDSVRNITVCSGCTVNQDTEPTLFIARLVSAHLAEYVGSLPRKFKISFSSCARACAKPWINDLGFIANGDGRFTAVGAGSLGPRPGTGTLLYENVAARDVLPLCLAALEFFKGCGQRANRSRARLRHLRERLGDEAFRSELGARFDHLRRTRNWPDIPPATGRHDLHLLWRLQLPNGNISVEDATLLARTAQDNDTELRINLEHGLELFGVRPCTLPRQLAALADLPILIACPGSSSCSKALVDTWVVADAIRRELAGLPRSNLRIAVSGCPNGCAHSAVADIGLTGVRRQRDGGSTECFRLLIGGHNAIDDHQATGGDVLFAEDVPRAVERMLSSMRPQPPDE